MSYIYNLFSSKKKNNIIISNEDDSDNIEEVNKEENNKVVEKDNEDENEEDEKSESDEDEESESEEDKFENYIIPDSIQSNNKISAYCKILWNGIDHIAHWELQRKIDFSHATILAKSMKLDYKKYGEFIFYEPIHLGKIKSENKYKIIDGQHRLTAYAHLLQMKKYPIQQIPCIIWYTDTEVEFIDLFDRINARKSINHNKLMQYKIFDIYTLMEVKFGKNIWGSNRPKISKEIFTNKIRENDSVENLDATEIIEKICKINNEICNLSRAERCKKFKIKCNTATHISAEQINFYLAYSKTLDWIDEL